MTAISDKRILSVLCALALCGILTAGLWPFHTPKNDVRWLSNNDGLQIGKYGSVISRNEFKEELAANTACSIEIWLEPRTINSSGAILAFYSGESASLPFELRQSLGDLELMGSRPDARPKRTKAFVDDLFNRSSPVFVTISLNSGGTAVYADGSFIKTFPGFRFSSRDLTGRLILGNAPATTDSWSGRLMGMAVYEGALSADEVSQHYKSWTTNLGQSLSQRNGTVALYAFNEKAGTVIHNLADSATDLVIPERFFVLRERFLVPPWEEYWSGWSYWEDLLVNVSGFVPLGFCFCAYFTLVQRMKRATLATIVLGFAVSLTIEVLQAFLPTRDSGMTDIFTNTLGTAVGALCFTSRPVQGLLPSVARYAKDGFSGPMRGEEVQAAVLRPSHCYGCEENLTPPEK